MTRRVVITCAGIVGPMALDTLQFWELVRSGKSAIRKISSFDSVPTGCHIGGEVPDFSLSFIPARLKPKRQARHTHLLLKAAEQIRSIMPQSGDFGIMVGLATSDLSMVAESGVKRAKGGFENACPIMISQCSPHAAAGALSIYLECRGEVNTVSTACAAGMDAIGLAFRDISSGRTNFVVAGGADCPIGPSPLAEFVRSGLSSRRSRFPERSSRPFDAFADSGVLSEAAGLLVLEEEQSARLAGRTPLCEVIGYANLNDFDPTVPGCGYSGTMIHALESAGLTDEDIDAIFAWGPGHPVLDRAEADALEEVFGDAILDIPVTSIKGVIGNPLAGAGPLQVAAAAFSLAEGIVPPTANHEVPLPGIRLDIVTDHVLYAKPEIVLLNAHGVGGANCSLVLKRCSSEPIPTHSQ